MRIETSGNYAWRKDLYDRAGEILGEGTRSGAIDESCRFVVQMIGDRTSKGALQEALEHPDMTPELAEVLSTNIVDLEIEERREMKVE